MLANHRPIRSQYEDFMRHVRIHGVYKTDRTGTGTTSVFGHQMRFDLNEGFPLVTTKKVLFPAVVRELVWFLKGSTNINDDLHQHTPIWDAWADEHGELGPIYGRQWRSWGGTGIDQIQNALDTIKKDPTSRRIIVSAWNVSDIPKMRLPPCHALFQFYVADRFLDCQLYQRSGDLALGVPFNIASYALLTHMVAQVCGLGVGDFVHTLGDAHLYDNHVDQAREQLSRTPRALPELKLNPEVNDLFAFRYEDIAIAGYDPLPAIKAPVAV